MELQDTGFLEPDSLHLMRAKQAQPEDWQYEIDWIQQDFSESKEADGGDWLILADKQGLAEKLGYQPLFDVGATLQPIRGHDADCRILFDQQQSVFTPEFDHLEPDVCRRGIDHQPALISIPLDFNALEFRLDLATGMPHIDADWVGANFTPPEQR